MKIFVCAFMFSLLLGASAFATPNCSIYLSTNQMAGQPEHISGVDIKIEGQYLPVRGPLNIEPNDTDGHIDMSPDFTADDKSQIVLAVDNNIKNGHKVGPGMPLTLVLGDGTIVPIAETLSGVVDSQFGYTLPLELAAGVSLSVRSNLVGAPFDSYYRNALGMCMHSKFQQQETHYTFTAGGRTFTRTTQQVLTVQQERWAPLRCRRGSRVADLIGTSEAN